MEAIAARSTPESPHPGEPGRPSPIAETPTNQVQLSAASSHWAHARGREFAAVRVSGSLGEAGPRKPPPSGRYIFVTSARARDFVRV